MPAEKKKPVVLMMGGFDEIGEGPTCEATVRAKYGAMFDIRPFAGNLTGTAQDAAFAEAEGLLNWGGPQGSLTPDLIARMPKLQISASQGVGFDAQDKPLAELSGKSLIDVADEAGIWLTNTAGSLTESTADAALLLLLATSRNFIEAHHFAVSGKWGEVGLGGVFDIVRRSVEPARKTLGIIGMGRIGQALARKCVGAFDMDVIYFDPRGDATVYTDIPPRWRSVPFETLLRDADYISLHANLSRYNGGHPETASPLIGSPELKLMKSSCILISVARGPHIDEAALVAGLEAGEIKAAGLDVTEAEPDVSPALLKLANEGKVALMPHIGSGTPEARVAMMMFAWENLRQVLVEKAPPPSPINGFATPQGHVHHFLQTPRMETTTQWDVKRKASTTATVDASTVTNSKL